MDQTHTSRTDELQRELSLGVDVGGTNIHVALVASDGRIQDSKRISTEPERGREAMFADVEEVLRVSLDGSWDQVNVIGAAVAGLVDRQEGLVHTAPNIGWSNVPLADELQARFDCPVQVCNDVDAATWGEWKYGAGQGVDDMVLAYVGTGFGTGVVTGGQLLEGCRSSAAELGHLPIVANGRPCTSPHSGCIEAYASGWAIGERAREAVRDQPGTGTYLKQLAGSVDEITARHVSQGFRENDELSTKLVEETGELLGVWAVGVLNVFHPERLVMGGSVYDGIPELKTWIEEHVEEEAFPPHRAELTVTGTELGDRAPVVGAATFARQHREQ